MKKIVFLIFLLIISLSCNDRGENGNFEYILIFYESFFSYGKLITQNKFSTHERDVAYHKVFLIRLNYIYYSLIDTKWDNKEFYSAFNELKTAFGEDWAESLVEAINYQLLYKFIDNCPKNISIDISRLKVFFKGCETNEKHLSNYKK